jgi:hypothetical protein
MPIYTGYPGANSTYVPSFDAGGKLQVEFSRNPKKFAINKYLKLIPVKKSVGFYLYISPENAARLVSNNDRVWHDGQEAPTGDDNHMSHMFRKYATIRYADAFTLGDKAVDQADWEIIASYSRMAAQQAMIGRTRAALAALTAGGVLTTDTATNVGGGKLDAGVLTSSATLYCRRAFLAIAEIILKATYSAVQRQDLIAVMNPHTAGRIAQSLEMVDFLKQSPVSLQLVRGDSVEAGSAMNWNLPEMFMGFKIVIEDTTYNSARPTAGQSTGTPTYALADGAILFLSRPEGLLGSEGVTNFSTAQIFSYEDMTVETRADPDNRRRQGRVVDDFDVQVAAPASGYYLTGCVD